MATAAPTEGLPIFYNTVEPINLEQHGKMKVRGMTSIPQMGQTHAVPVTVDEFALVAAPLSRSSSRSAGRRCRSR